MLKEAEHMRNKTLRRARYLDRLEEAMSEFLIHPLACDSCSDFEAPTAVFVTAPHAASRSEDEQSREIRDPLSGILARQIAAGLNAKCVSARVHRATVDQNRLWGLFAAGDMAPALIKYRRSRGDSMRATLHLDIHTFTSNRPMPGWGSGVNIVIMQDAPEQRRYARELANGLDRRLTGSLPRTTIVEMDARPLHPRDDNSNALIEWSRSHGAVSLLCELPCTCVESGCALDRCWKVDSNALADAMVATANEIVTKAAP